MVFNLLKHTVTDLEEAVLKEGLNFTIAFLHSNLDMACVMETVISNLPPLAGV
jgi:hypothetical protein